MLSIFELCFFVHYDIFILQFNNNEQESARERDRIR